MSLKNTILTALNALLVHRTRSLLTILGIVIGIASIIIVMALGNGAQKLILDQISGLGAETAVVRPGESFADITNALYSQSLTQRDLTELEKKSNVPNLASAAPVVIVSDSVEYRGKSYRPTIIAGPAEFMLEVYGIAVREGRVFTESDIGRYERVAVIGSEFRNDLFENRQAIGQNIRIKDSTFRIVGVMEKKGTLAGFNFDSLVMIPHTSAQRYVTGTDYYAEIILKADSAENVDKMTFDVAATLRDTHNIGFGEKDDFNIQTQQNLVEQIALVTAVFTAFLTAVVAISLVVGGVGIMNIVLVSVTERTKEIGLRKALGATRKDISRQFLFEAVILTSLGGLFGIIIGTVIALLISIILIFTIAPDWSFTFPLFGAMLGLFVSGGIGLIFGIYPANLAAKKNPVEALTYE